MNIVGAKVKHRMMGTGTVIEQTDGFIKVQFTNKLSKFSYPAAFESFLSVEDNHLKECIVAELTTFKEAASNQTNAKNEAVMAEIDSKRLAPHKLTPETITHMFGKDYNVQFLAQKPILTYQEVEAKYHINLTGFGRGINITPTQVVLISNINRVNNNFVYHDCWTADGDYLYSGEGKTGDQVLKRGNAAIVNAARYNKEIHLLVKFSSKEYYDQGSFILKDYTLENRKDMNGFTRKEFIFRLKKAN